MTHKSRPPEEELEHDEVIDKIVAERYNSSEYSVETNPDGDHNYSVDGKWPDIVAIKDNEPYIIGEVETESSVDDDEALGQWKPYSELGITFYLYVPRGKCSEAKRLCSEYGITVSGFRHYFIGEDGDFHVENCV